MKRMLKILGFSFLGILLLSFLTVQLFGGRISRGVITGLNKSMNTEIKVEDVNVSLLRSFPNLSVNLTDFIMVGSDGTPLLEAERVSCLISLSSLFGKTRIKTIVVADGALQVYVDVDGNTNYQLLEYQPVDVQMAEEQNGSSEAIAFAIDDARLENVELIYQNDQLNLAASAFIFDANFRGDFGTEVYDMATQTNAEIRFLDNGDQRLLAGESLRVGANSQVNNKTQTYEYRELSLGIGGLNLKASGSMQQLTDGIDMNMVLESEESTLTDLLRLIPSDQLGVLEELRSTGKFRLAGRISEKWTEARQPRMDFQLSFTNGRLSSKRMDVSAKDLSFVGNFSNGQMRLPRTSVFAIEKLSGNFGRHPFSLSMRVENFDDPIIALGADGAFPLEALPGLLPEGILDEGDGLININGLRVSGRYENMLSPRLMARVKTGGSLAFDDVELVINDRQIDFPEGQLLFRDNELELDNFRLQAAGNDISFSGRAINFIPVMFADSLNTQDAHLEFRALLQAEELDIDELLAFAGPTEEEIEAADTEVEQEELAKKSVTRRAQITDLLNGQFDAQVKEWNYGEIEGENFRGQLVFKPQELNIRGETEAMKGNFQIDGEMYFVESPRLQSRVTANNVDINEFFRQSENFGQEVLTDDNLRGRLDSKMSIKAYFNPAGELDYDKLTILAGIEINDGELREFKMLENFAAALKAKDLARVRFSNLENFLEISRSTIYFPAMFIQSSAMNLTVSGSHTFSQVMDYNLKVNAGQVLANKIAKHDRDLELLPARRNGFFNLYYTITGNLENFNYRRDKRKVKAKFTQSEERRRRIQRNLARDFAEAIPPIEEPGDWGDQGI